MSLEIAVPKLWTYEERQLATLKQYPWKVTVKACSFTEEWTLSLVFFKTFSNF